MIHTAILPDRPRPASRRWPAAYPRAIESRVAGDAPAATGRDPDATAPARPPVRSLTDGWRARAAVVAYFAVLGVANGVWLARIPAVKQDLHLSDGVLGLALLAAPAGLVVVAPVASRIVHRAGSRRPTLIAGTCAALVPIALGLASGLPELMAALFAFGLAGGMLDVGMNSQAVLVERQVRRPR